MTKMCLRSVNGVVLGALLAGVMTTACGTGASSTVSTGGQNTATGGSSTASTGGQTAGAGGSSTVSTGGQNTGSGGSSVVSTGGRIPGTGGSSVVSTGGRIPGTGGSLPASGGSSASGGTGSAGNNNTGGVVAMGGAVAGPTMRAANGQIYDSTGAVFLPWGVNKVHVDQSNTGLELTGTNAVRVNLYFRLPNAVTTALMDRFYAAKIVLIPGRWDATCEADSTFPAKLAAEVDAWVAESAAWKKYERASIINIANEAGPANSTVWRDQYIIAVGRMRAAGYAGLLMIDSGGCGQDVEDIAKYGADVVAADPLQNIVFGFHIYGETASAAQMDTKLDRLKATGLSIVVGEFGPGRNIGPSPTNITPQEVMTSSFARGIGTLAWAADDNNLSNSMANDNWFSMFYNLGKAYSGSADDLTVFGKVVVNDPKVGLLAVAKKAGGF